MTYTQENTVQHSTYAQASRNIKEIHTVKKEHTKENQANKSRQ